MNLNDTHGVKGLGDGAERRAAMLKARDALTELRDLIGESQGVYGLHLNGDPSPWDELEAGGRFERLTSLDEATEALNAALGVMVDAPTPSDGVWEALQRLIENAQTLGPASREDALLVAKWRGQFIAARELADGVPAAETQQGGDDGR